MRDLENLATTMDRKDQIFLSHAGEDSTFSRQLALEIGETLAKSGSKVNVFNTSDPEHRFRDFLDIVSAGERWDSSEWEEELRGYLRSNIQDSAAYLLLVTPISLQKNSQWIQFEIDTAADIFRTQGIHFIPCACGDHCLRLLPEKARIFQGIDISNQNGISMLCGVLNKILTHDKNLPNNCIGPREET